MIHSRKFNNLDKSQCCYLLTSKHPDVIHMKPDSEQENSSGLTLQESFDGDPGSESCPTKTCTETLFLRQVEESVGRFCRRLKYSKKCFNVPDESPSNPDKNVKLSISQPSNSNETPRKKFICNLCGVEYWRRANLVSHMRIHTGETPYCCELCGKKFRRSDWLKLHIKTHTGEKRQRTKRFVCEQCGKTFTCSTSLQYHMWKHSGERPYACSICKKTYFSLCILRRHQNDSHSEEKAYSCSLCGHSFARMHALQKHTRIHTGEKPYSCSVCGKTFSYQYSLSMHSKLHSSKG